MKRIAIVLLMTAFMTVCVGLALAQDSAAQDTGAQDTAGDATTIAAALQERAELSTFASLLEQTGLGDELTEPGVFTVFAPTNEAFDALGEEALASILGNEGVIEAVLRNHIALGGSSSEALARMAAFTNLAGYQFLVTMEGDRMFVNEARVLTPDIEASNGVIHVIDTVLVPEPYWPLKNQSTIPSGGTSGGTGSGTD